MSEERILRKQKSTPTHPSASDIKSEIKQICMETITEEIIAKISDQYISKLEKTLGRLDEKLNNVITNLDALNIANLANKKSINALENKCDHLEQQLLKNFLRFTGIKESTNENTASIIIQLLKEQLKIEINKHDIESIYRIGKVTDLNNNTRPILVNLRSNMKKMEILNARKSFKNTPYAVFEEITKKRYNLLLATQKKYGKRNAWSMGGKIYIWNQEKKEKQVINSENDLNS